MVNSSVALVTGASSGIGRAVSRALAARGYALANLARDPDRLGALADELAPTTRVVSYSVDLARDEELRDVARRIAQDFGRLDALVHSSGLFAEASVASGSVDEFDAVFRVNVRAPFLLSQTLLPLLKASGGQVVFVNSSVARMPARAGQAAYAGSKAALLALADSLRAEVNAQGIRVLTVYPGRTATTMQERLSLSQGKDYRPERLLQPEDVANTLVSALELPRTAEVTDIAIRPMSPS